jgi:hypothetical protein
MTKRIETGVLAHDGDWPGFFMRGDDALSTARSLHAIAEKIDDPVVRAGGIAFLRRLADRLQECSVETERPQHK